MASAMSSDTVPFFVDGIRRRGPRICTLRNTHETTGAIGISFSTTSGVANRALVSNTFAFTSFRSKSEVRRVMEGCLISPFFSVSDTTVTLCAPSML